MEEEKVESEEPEVPVETKETPEEPVIEQRRGSNASSTVSERDEKLAKLRNIMQESTENLAKLEEEKKDDSLNIPDPFASWDSIGAKVEETAPIDTSNTDAFGFSDPWGSVEQTTQQNIVENETPLNKTRTLSSSSSSSSDSSAKEPDGSLEKDIFNTIKKQNSFSSTTFPTEEITPNPIELDLAPPKPPSPTPPPPSTDETTKNIFDSSDDDEDEKPKQEETKEIHSMLDMWNKKYDVSTPTTTPEPVSIPPPTTVNLIDIDINQTVDDVGCIPDEPVKLDAPILEPPTIEPPTPATPEEEKTEEKPEVKSETSGMNWDLSSSDDDSNEEKTQISNQKEKIMTTAKMINLDSTDDEVGKCLS